MSKKAKEPQNQVQFDNYYQKGPIVFGPFTTHIMRNDPKHMVFLFARYKFVAKMLSGKDKVLEIGCGDATGSPIVAQEAKQLYCTDFEPLLMDDNIHRLKNYKNISFHLLDMTKRPFAKKCDAAFSLDVLEHIKPGLERKFIINICRSLKKNGICIIGTPNITTKKYATKASHEGHINLKSHQDLQKILNKYFINGFLFSMNDEVVHTGFYPMANYLLAVGVGVK